MLPENDSELQSLIESYRAAGIDPVPLSPGAKSPDLAGWSKRESFSWEAFRGHNIGCRGTDVLPIDFDDPVAAVIALRMFDLVFDSQGGAVYDGRSSKPVSHLFVRLVDASTGEITRRPGKGAASPFKGKAKWAPPVGVGSGGAYLFELQHHRGLQAMIPPSVHSSGETLCWYVRDRAVSAIRVPAISADELLELLRCVWLVRALVPLWVEGHRHDLALWAGTWLYSAGVEECWAKLIIDGVLHQSGDDDPARAGQFLADWGAVEPTAVRRGIGGVREIVGKVLGESSVEDWFLRLGKYWPALRSGSTAAAVFDAAKDFASSTPAGVPLGTDAASVELARMQRECTFIVASSATSLMHDPGVVGAPAVVSVKSRQDAMGQVGWDIPAARKGVKDGFDHVLERWKRQTDKRVAQRIGWHPERAYLDITDGTVNVFQESPVVVEARLLNRVDSVSEDDPRLTVVLAWIRRVFPIEAECSLMCDWLSYLFRFPGRRLPWAIYSVAYEEGVGRGLIVALMARCLGRRNVTDLDIDDIDGSWSDWATGKLLRHVSESREPGSSRQSLVEKLKRVITNETVQVREKYKGTVEVPNYGGYWMASNDASDVRVDEATRRFCCLDNNGRLPTEAEIAEMVSVIEQHDVQVAVARWFLQRTGELPVRPPRTEMLETVREHSNTLNADLVEEAMEGMPRCFTLDMAVKRFDANVMHHNVVERRVEIRRRLRRAKYVLLRPKDRRVRDGEKKLTIYCHRRDKKRLENLSNAEILKILGGGNPPPQNNVVPIK